MNGLRYWVAGGDSRAAWVYVVEPDTKRVVAVMGAHNRGGHKQTIQIVSTVYHQVMNTPSGFITRAQAQGIVMHQGDLLAVERDLDPYADLDTGIVDDAM